MQYSVLRLARFALQYSFTVGGDLHCSTVFYSSRDLHCSTVFYGWRRFALQYSVLRLEEICTAVQCFTVGGDLHCSTVFYSLRGFTSCVDPAG